MSKGKNVTIKAPTAQVYVKAYPPKIITTKVFFSHNWKYIILTWIVMSIITGIGFILPFPRLLNFAFIMLLNVIPFFLGAKAITNKTIREIE